MPFSPHTSTLFKVRNMLKLVVIVNLECCIFVNYCFSKDSISIFTKCFKLASSTHWYNSRSVINGLLFLLSYNSDLCMTCMTCLYMYIYIYDRICVSCYYYCYYYYYYYYYYYHYYCYYYFHFGIYSVFFFRK